MRALVACHDSLLTHLLSRQFCEEMGPRTHGLHRSKKDAQKDSNKAKHTKSLKNKVRDVQRLLKKVRQVVNSFYGVQLHMFQTILFRLNVFYLQVIISDTSTF